MGGMENGGNQLFGSGEVVSRRFPHHLGFGRTDSGFYSDIHSLPSPLHSVPLVVLSFFSYGCLGLAFAPGRLRRAGKERSEEKKRKWRRSLRLFSGSARLVVCWSGCLLAPPRCVGGVSSVALVSRPSRAFLCLFWLHSGCGCGILSLSSGFGRRVLRVGCWAGFSFSFSFGGFMAVPLCSCCRPSGRPPLCSCRSGFVCSRCASVAAVRRAVRSWRRGPVPASLRRSPGSCSGCGSPLAGAAFCSACAAAAGRLF